MRRTEGSDLLTLDLLFQKQFEVYITKTGKIFSKYILPSAVTEGC